MASIGNNINGKVSHVRECFFDSDEKAYFDALLTIPDEKELHHRLLKADAKKLYKTAMHFILGVEQGKYSESEMIKVEHIIVHCLGAIEDMQMVQELTR